MWELGHKFLLIKINPLFPYQAPITETKNARYLSTQPPLQANIDI